MLHFSPHRDFLKVGAIASLAFISQSFISPFPAIAQPGNPENSTFTCVVSGIKKGQLALRNEPAGPAFAGLNNGNVVRAMLGIGQIVYLNDIQWTYVRVVKGPNSKINNREGFVNRNYLTCDTN